MSLIGIIAGAQDLELNSQTQQRYQQVILAHQTALFLDHKAMRSPLLTPLHLTLLPILGQRQDLELNTQTQHRCLQALVLPLILPPLVMT
jgi:hypothetical protein